jgi:hypothetical protein
MASAHMMPNALLRFPDKRALRSRGKQRVNAISRKNHGRITSKAHGCDRAILLIAS